MRTPFLLWTRLRSRSRKVEQIHHIDEKPESARKLRRGARVRGRKAGRAAAFGHPQAQRIQELPGRVLLQKAVQKRKTHTEMWINNRSRALRASIAEMPARITKAGAEAKGAKEAVKQLEHDRAALPSDHSPSLFTYLLVLGLLASAEYPTLTSALRVFPFDANTRQFLACILSGVLAVAAHYLATRIRAMREARAEARPWGFEALFVGLFVVVVVGLMATMGLTRGDAFGTLAALTGNAFGDPMLLTALMLAVQVTLFVIALAVGLQHSDGDARRQLVKRIRRAKRDARLAVAWHERLVALKADDEEELKVVDETKRLWLAREDELLAELLARHDHAYETTEHSVLTRMLARVIVPQLREARA